MARIGVPFDDDDRRLRDRLVQAGHGHWRSLRADATAGSPTSTSARASSTTSGPANELGLPLRLGQPARRGARRAGPTREIPTSRRCRPCSTSSSRVSPRPATAHGRGRPGDGGDRRRLRRVPLGRRRLSVRRRTCSSWWRRVDARSVGVVDEDGRVIGVGFLRTRAATRSPTTRPPEERGRGAGSLLLDWGERRTAETGLSSVRPGTTARDTHGKELLERRGYRYIRSFYRMVIDLDEPPPSPVWPDGFGVALEPAEERLIHETLEEAFEDHLATSREPSRSGCAQTRPLEQALCYVVRTEDGAPAAAQVCDEDSFGIAWVSILGVLPAWRRDGSRGGAAPSGLPRPLRARPAPHRARGRRREHDGGDAALRGGSACRSACATTPTRRCCRTAR